MTRMIDPPADRQDDGAQATNAVPYDEWPVGRLVCQISAMIDGTYPQTLDREAWLFRRVMKVAEETGEVTEALLGSLGENPRKGKTHTLDDVRKELMDVALAALGACAHIDADRDPEADFAWHVMGVYERLLKVLTKPCIALVAPAERPGGDA